MTPALKAMVEAMAADIKRQVALQMDSGPGAYPDVVVEPGYLVVFENAGAFNLEKAVRAGLATLKGLDQSVTLAMHEAAKSQFDLHGAYQKIGDAMVDAILKPAP